MSRALLAPRLGLGRLWGSSDHEDPPSARARQSVRIVSRGERWGLALVAWAAGGRRIFRAVAGSASGGGFETGLEGQGGNRVYGGLGCRWAVVHDGQSGQVGHSHVVLPRCGDGQGDLDQGMAESAGADDVRGRAECDPCGGRRRRVRRGEAGSGAAAQGGDRRSGVGCPVAGDVEDRSFALGDHGGTADCRGGRHPELREQRDGAGQADREDALEHGHEGFEFQRAGAGAARGRANADGVGDECVGGRPHEGWRGAVPASVWGGLLLSRERSDRPWG